MPENHKVTFASLHLSGVAENWFQTEATIFEKLSWLEFAGIVNARFSEEICENIIGEFNKLYQAASLSDYNEKFETLRPLVLLKNPGLSELYFVESYLSGLKEEIRHTVLMFRPSSVMGAMQLARLQEASIESMQKTAKNSAKSKSFTSFSPINRLSSVPNNSFLSKNAMSVPNDAIVPKDKMQHQWPIKRLSPAEMQSRKERGLCFNCDEQYSSSHRCKSKTLYLLDYGDEDQLGLTDTGSVPAQSVNSTNAKQTDIAISLNALAGNSTFQMLCLQGKVGQRTSTMLIDTGNTHNFLDVQTAKEL
ncbi:hypothetical protein ACHQM5_024643 [Ranunculus cassubicifolius]